MNESTLGRTPACDSFETGFFDGTLRLFADPEVPCSFGALCGDVALSAGAIEKEAPPFPTDFELSIHVSRPADCLGRFLAGRFFFFWRKHLTNHGTEVGYKPDRRKLGRDFHRRHLPVFTLAGAYPSTKTEKTFSGDLVSDCLGSGPAIVPRKQNATCSITFPFTSSSPAPDLPKH